MVQFLDSDHFLVSFSNGSVKLYKVAVDIDGGTYRIEEEYSWEKLHSLVGEDGASCNSFALYDNDVASVGEDGRLNLLSVKQKCIVRTIGKFNFIFINSFECSQFYNI